MREELIEAWPQIRAFLWGALMEAILVGAIVYYGVAQKHQHAANRQAINAVDLSWEICRAAEGMPAKHDKGGGWIRTDGLTSEQVEKAESSFDEWAWTDKAGKFTRWPGHEDDAANEDDDVCSTAWRAGYSAAVPEDRP